MALEIVFNNVINHEDYPEAKELGMNSIVVNTDTDNIWLGGKLGEIGVFMNKVEKTYSNVIKVSPYYEEE